ncbi:MAG: cobalt-precorrin 5A hydrolase [Synergistes sp.]|nr:cobalt-precorrin 5A hydrolase [Synergistes sp.]
MKLHAAAFSQKGAELALKIAKTFDGTAWSTDNYAKGDVKPFGASLGEWTKAHFDETDALVFVSSCGIAVRAIAPCLKSKATDPAVVVVDERGLSAISLLSGHIGGANDLALQVAEVTGARPVITTATDVNGITAPDSWAVKNNCTIENLKAAKQVAAELLAGHEVGVAVTDELQPAPYPVTLWLRPRDLFLGVGCKRGTDPALLRERFEEFMKESGFSPLSVASVASVAQKRDEAAIIELADSLGVPFETFTAEELAALPGDFTPSAAPLAAVGVDNVCERSAFAASRGGFMVRLKKKYPGITFALARKRNE